MNIAYSSVELLIRPSTGTSFLFSPPPSFNEVAPLNIANISVIAQYLCNCHTSVLAQDPYLYPAPGGGLSNRPTTVVSSATSLAWIKNPRNVGAAAVDSITTEKNRETHCLAGSVLV